MEGDLIHLPVPEVYIEAFTDMKRNNLAKNRNRFCNSDLFITQKQETETNTNANVKTQTNKICLQQSQTSRVASYDDDDDECIVDDHKEETQEFCHLRVKDKDNVVHLTNLNSNRWNESKISEVLKQINPYWNEEKIKIYILHDENKGLLTASIEFKSREYSEKALELIESNFNLFVNHRNIVASAQLLSAVCDPIDYVTGIKLKLIKQNLNTNHVFSCYGQTIIPLKFDIKAIIANYYHLHCNVTTKLEYYQNLKLLHDIPTAHDIKEYLFSCKYPPILNCYHNELSTKLMLTIYFPFITLCIMHETERYYFYICGNLLSLYQFKATQNKYIPIVTRAVSPSLLSSLLYIDVLALIDSTGYYTFYDSMNSNFECDLYRSIAQDLNENEIAPYNLMTMKLPNSESQLDRCVICLNMIDKYEFTRISSCRHLFHFNCIKRLLQFNCNKMNQQIWDQQLNCYITTNYAYCPLCRRQFTAIQSRICNVNLKRPTVQFINVTDICLIGDNCAKRNANQMDSQETSSVDHDETSVSNTASNEEDEEYDDDDDEEFDLEEEQDEYNEDATSYYESFDDD